MTWLSGPCINPDDSPAERLVGARSEFEQMLDEWESEPLDPEQPISSAARWPGHEIEDDPPKPEPKPEDD